MTMKKIRNTEQAWDDRTLGAQAEFVGFMSYWRNEANVKIINSLKQSSAGSSGG